MSIQKLHLIENQYFLGIWKIDETEEELKEYLHPKWLSEDFFNIQHPQKRLEWLASRCLVKKLSEKSGFEYSGIEKDDFGKPFLKNCAVEISFSHTFRYAAAILDFATPTGIDIEQIDAKFTKIAPKFLSPQELEFTQQNLEEIAYHWCAKEALYKLFGKKQLSFKNNIFIIKPFEGEGVFEGIIEKGELKMKIRLKGEKLGDYLVVFAIR
ncbi:MAG: hypothetical protein OHK0038_08090 [Flammeovirgaceae bacterium]